MRYWLADDICSICAHMNSLFLDPTNVLLKGSCFFLPVENVGSTSVNITSVYLKPFQY